MDLDYRKAILRDTVLGKIMETTILSVNFRLLNVLMHQTRLKSTRRLSPLTRSVSNGLAHFWSPAVSITF